MISLSKGGPSLALLIAPLTFGQAEFQIIGEEFPVGFRCGAVSADGTTVVGWLDSNEAFRWDAERGPETIPRLEFATDVSADGSFIVGRVMAILQPDPADPTVRIDGLRAARRGPTGDIDVLGALREPEFINDRWNAFSSVAHGISADGTVVVGSATGPTGPNQAFRWVEGEGIASISQIESSFALFEEFDILVRSEARAVSADGNVVAGSAVTPMSPSILDSLATRWTESEFMVELEIDPAVQKSGARGISDDGQVLVGVAQRPIGEDPSGTKLFTSEAMLWRSDGTATILLPERSIAIAASGDGSTLVGVTSVGATDFDTAFIWTESAGAGLLEEVLAQEYGVSTGGWTLTAARDVSRDGRTIVGDAVDPAGSEKVFVVQLPPLEEVPACSPADITSAGVTWSPSIDSSIPDGRADLSDLGFLLLAWLNLDARYADITTTGAGIEGAQGYLTPDGNVDLDDLGVFLSVWLLGC
ncbi:MAG: GC-type dockerin domain-anchored protein [Planctomycetota bacterium]